MLAFFARTMNKEEINEKVQHIASTMKLMCGIGNNAAWLVCLEAYDHIRKSRLYFSGHRARYEFKRTTDMYHKYEQQLIYAYNNRLFNVADMPPSLRKKFGNITNRDYYDLWAATGATAYQEAKQYVTSLQNKYRLLFDAHHQPEADAVAWAYTAMACLNMAVRIYDTAIKGCVNDTGIAHNIIDKVFGQLSLKTIADAWSRAKAVLAPQAESIAPTPAETKNINFGLDQLFESLTNPRMIFKATKFNVEDFAEIFRTPGEMKKTLAEIEKIEELTINELES